MKVSFRTLVLVAIVLTLVALPSAVMAAGGQSLTATVATVFGSAAHSDPIQKPPHPHPPGTVPPPTATPTLPPIDPTATPVDPTATPVNPTATPVNPTATPVNPTATPVNPTATPVNPTATPAPSGATAANVGTYQIVKVIGDRLSSTIYAYTDNDWLYRSDRNGSGWRMVVTDPAVEDFLMSAADPNVLYSGAGQNCAGSTVAIAPMYKSVDGGETWTELPAGINLKPMLLDPANADILFAADCTTLYLSTDGGESWSPRPAAAADNIWQTYSPADMSSGSLVGSPPPTTPHWDQIFAVGNDVQDAGTVAFTGDQGTTWVTIADPQNPILGAKVVVASLSEGGKLWVAGSKGVWSTADYGVNWSLSKLGLDYLVKTHTSFNDLTYGHNGSLYLATSKGLYVQSEPGGAWRMPDADDVDFSDEAMHSLLITESNPTRLWINAEKNDNDDDSDPIVFTMLVK
jgi:photosystem II stability/assembly factor-like uncharacterized protein